MLTKTLDAYQTALKRGKGLVRMKVHIFYTGKTSLMTAVNIWVGPANGGKTGKSP
jgi:hypothetical protein